MTMAYPDKCLLKKYLAGLPDDEIALKEAMCNGRQACFTDFVSYIILDLMHGHQ
jgi:hypothetical protein